VKVTRYPTYIPADVKKNTKELQHKLRVLSTGNFDLAAGADSKVVAIYLSHTGVLEKIASQVTNTSEDFKKVYFVLEDDVSFGGGPLQVKDWAEVQAWMHGIQEKLYPSAPGKMSLSFDAVSRVVEEIGANYGAYNKKECAKLKYELLDVESKKAGRVRLTEFYKKGLKGVFEFNEKIDYLRVLGAVDESDPEQPHVIVSNYVSSRPNCLVSSTFYAICCRNECEDLIGELERKFSNELASPAEILGLVATLSSDTVEAPRKLSAALTQRLHSIANSNGGQVPLHGRLFAQWMHHAFPRECPYPHEAGSTNPQTPDEWMQETGHQDSKLSKEELMAHVKDESSRCTGSGCIDQPKGAEARMHHHFQENELPWSETEELLLPTTEGSKAKGQVPKKKYPFEVVFLVFSAMVVGLAWFIKTFLLGASSPQPSKAACEVPCGSPTSCPQVGYTYKLPSKAAYKLA